MFTCSKFPFLSPQCSMLMFLSVQCYHVLVLLLLFLFVAVVVLCFCCSASMFLPFKATTQWSVFCMFTLPKVPSQCSMLMFSQCCCCCLMIVVVVVCSPPCSMLCMCLSVMLFVYFVCLTDLLNKFWKYNWQVLGIEPRSLGFRSSVLAITPRQPAVISLLVQIVYDSIVLSCQSVLVL